MNETTERNSPIEIRSYRTVFELERRLYRIDRLRLPPGGIPMRGALYCLGLVIAVVAVSALPVIGSAVGLLPWYLRDLAAPIALAALLALVRIEGRPFHVAVRSLLAHRLGSRWWSALRPARGSRKIWRPPELLMLPDGSEGRWRPFAFRGPGAVMVSGAHHCRDRRGGSLSALIGRPHVTLRQRSGGAVQSERRVVALSAGARLRISPAGRRRRFRAERSQR